MSILEMSNFKDKCQIFTPADIVAKMLDLADYSNDLCGKTILENCCGDGAILSQIVERYIQDALRNGVPSETLSYQLSRDIIAYEIDQQLVTACRQRLSAIAEKYNIRNVDWTIHNSSFLESNDAEYFDYIVGNPPYIAYSDLPETEREKIRKSFSTCKKGKFDYSYAFIEKSFGLLKKGGKMVYIIPSSIFKNLFADELRMLIKPDLTTIIDYPQDKIFSNVLVSPAIIKVEKGADTSTIEYTEIIEKKTATTTLSKDKLAGKWVFHAIRKKGTRVGDYFKVSNAVATLCNKVFILQNGSFEGNTYRIGTKKIETSILKKAVSPKSKRYSDGRTEYMVFPYSYNENGALTHYSEAEMLEQFPFTMEYLSQYRDALQSRAADQSAGWYEFGRSQALQNMNQKKIMISTVISDETTAYMLDVDEIPYAGLYIIPTANIPLESLLVELNSKRFRQYAIRVGISVSGSCRRITTKDIENYVFGS